MANVEPDKLSLFRELETFNLFSQGNIYTSKITNRPLCLPPKTSMGVESPGLMVGTLKPPKILSIALPNMESNDTSVRDIEEDNFSCHYLQLDDMSQVNTELIAFDVFDFQNDSKENKYEQEKPKESRHDYKFNICVTDVKIDITEDDQYDKTFSLKIYEKFKDVPSPRSLAESSKAVPIMELKCLATFHLDFIPYCLTHCSIPGLSNEEVEENILLLSGSDDLIHGFRKKFSSNDFYELEDDQMINVFPECANLTQSPVTAMSFVYHDLKRVIHRWSVLGCQDGQLHVFQVDPLKRELLMSFEDLEFAGIGGIHQAKFFSTPRLPDSDNSILNLMVAPSFERSALYLDISNQLQLEKETQRLECSSDFDSVNACAILDIDGDNYPEIILGTYGQELIVYKVSNEDQNVASNIAKDILPSWTLLTRQTFPFPILAVNGWKNPKAPSPHQENFSANSMLAVTTIKAVHILEYDRKNANLREHTSQ